ncbi:MAG TPA: glycosyltransferase [Anaerolineae bacterium]|nr:glycosyltransferase [Anaerolineae bacterium]
MKPLNILFISPYIPSLIRVRPYNFIKALAERGHHLTLLALEPPGEDTSSLETLRRWCQYVETAPLPRWRTLWNGVQAIPSPIPFQAAYSRSPQMAELIERIQASRPFDVVHVEHLRGAELSEAVKGTPIVFDSVDSITLLFERVLQAGPTWSSRMRAKLDLARTRSYEGRLLERFRRVLVTSPHDRDTLATLATIPAADHRLIVLPNGVDLDYFIPMDLPREPATLVFTGKMSYHANVAAALDLATQVMPLVWQHLPEARLNIVGKDPTAELLALTTDPRITVTGTVPDMRPYLAQATAAISPMRYGVGIQNKVLEAMAMATPVISTPQAVSALQVQAGQEALVAGAPEAMAQAVVSLLTDPALRQRTGQAGRRYVETHHDWRLAAAKLETLYQEVIAETQGVASYN